jgi:hypothetical protein
LDLHDLRRVVRSELSRLRVDRDVAEKVIRAEIDRGSVA